MSPFACTYCDGHGSTTYSAELSDGAPGRFETAACRECIGGILRCICCNVRPATQHGDPEPVCDVCARELAADVELDSFVCDDTLPAMRAALGAE